MLAVSTVWRSKKAVSGKGLIDDMLSLPTERIELEFRIPHLMFEEIRPFIDNGDVSVVSIHNYFPVPDVLMPSQGSGDAFLLSSDDENERKLAVTYSGKTLETAAGIGVKNVVFHLGLVSVGHTKHSLMRSLVDEALGGGGKGKIFSKVHDLRSSKRDLYFDNCLKSLDELVRVADKNGVVICIENRLYPTEIPDLEEMSMIFERFAGAPLKYWHDVGHAVIQERLGFVSAIDLIRENRDRMAGIHLHDVSGFRDHLSPGTGEVDFSHLSSILPDDILHVMEVHEQASLSEMTRSIQLLSELGF